MTRDYENMIALLDSEGNELNFEILDVIAYKGSDYAVLLPTDNDADEQEAVILKVLPGSTEDAENTFAGLDDAGLLEEIYAEFLKRSKDVAGTDK